MAKIKKGDIVGRLSYGKDILFIVKNIIKKNDSEYIAILKGLTVRIEADAPIEDIVIVRKDEIENNMRNLDTRLENRIKKCKSSSQKGFLFYRSKFLGRSNFQEITGKILHLDGDKKYSIKSEKYYNKIGLDAIVKNIPENKQQFVVIDLLNRFKPDILIITGHDGMIKNRY